jgi:hypothetical protein
LAISLTTQTGWKKSATTTMATSSSDPHPIPLTESEVLIRGFIAANPDLVAGEPVAMMTDRYTNEEWNAQIQETGKAVLKEVDSGERAKKMYEGPRMRDGKEALKQLALTVDHTVLKLDATSTAIDGLCSSRYVFSSSHFQLQKEKEEMDSCLVSGSCSLMNEQVS